MSGWWIVAGLAAIAFVVALWAYDRRKKWATGASIISTVLAAAADPIQAIVQVFDLRSERKRRKKK